MNGRGEEGSGRIAAAVKWHVVTAFFFFGAGWTGCWQVHDHVMPKIGEEHVGPDQAPRFWDLQTREFAALREGQQTILQALTRIELKVAR